MIALIGGIRSIIAAVTGAAVMWVALSAYDILDDRAVAKAAREGMVSVFEAESAKALNAALLLASKAQSTAAAEANREREMLSRWHDIETTRMEGEIADLNAELEKTGRRWLLDQSDIDRMRDATRRGQAGR